MVPGIPYLYIYQRSTHLKINYGTSAEKFHVIQCTAVGRSPWQKWIYLWIADLIYIFVNASDILDEIEPL